MQRKIINYLMGAFFSFFILGGLSCGGPGKIALDPESRDFYEIAQLIMTKHEKAIFRHLPDKESREEFIEDFWAKRDPDPHTDENIFKDEFFRRIEYANKRFKEGLPGWKTDRGRIYIYLGPPDKFDEFFIHNELDFKGERIRGSLLIWYYYRYQLGIKFVDRDGTGHFTFDPSPYEMGGGLVGSLTDAIDRAKLGITSDKEGFTKKFVNFDVKFDNKKKEIVVSIPVKSIMFKEEDGLLKADFEFEFYIYEKKDLKKVKFKEAKSFAKPEDEVLELDDIIFTFPYNLNQGKFYFDVIIIIEGGLGKARKILEIKV